MKKSLLLSLLVLLLVAACSGGGQSATPLPTPTAFPTYSYVSPTPMPGIQEAEATATAEAAAGADPELISRGRDRYVALKCGDCHGENGEGNGDKGPKLVGLTLTADEFLSFLRSGGKLGSAHQFASNRISVQGVQNLYLYLQSLSS